MNLLVTLDWIFLGTLAYVTVWAVLERVQFHLLHRPMATTEFVAGLLAWERDGRVSERHPLASGHWLAALRYDAGQSLTQLLSSCHALRDSVLRWQSFLPIAGNLAVSAGLFGSVLALEKSSHSKDASAVLGLGMHATLAGVGVAMIAALAYLLLRRPTQCLQMQVERTIEVLEQVMLKPPGDAPPAGALVPVSPTLPPGLYTSS